jgi:hypothetical protein
MHVAGVVLVVLGIGWPVLAVPCLVVWHFLLGEGPGRTRRKAARMPLLTCEQLNSAGSLPRRVAVTGVTAPGLHGLLRAPVSGEDCVWYESAVINDFSVSESRHDWVCRLAPESFVAVADGPARVFLTPYLAGKLIGPQSAAVMTETIEEVTPYTGRPGWDNGTRLATLRDEGSFPAYVFTPRRDRKRASYLYLNILLTTNHFSIHETIVRPGMEIFVIGKPSRKPGVGIVLKVPFGPISGISSLPVADVHRYLASRATRSLRLIGISFAAGLALIPIGDLLTHIFKP